VVRSLLPMDIQLSQPSVEKIILPPLSCQNLFGAYCMDPFPGLCYVAWICAPVPPNTLQHLDNFDSKRKINTGLSESSHLVHLSQDCFSSSRVCDILYYLVLACLCQNNPAGVL
jgi:hypothetical protein